MPGPVARRPGVSLIEVVVATAILLVLAVAFLPSLRSAESRDQIADAANILYEIMEATMFSHSDNQDYPSYITHLTTPITTAQKNYCGASYPVGKVNNWDGPYLTFSVPTTGIDLGIGVIPDTVVRELISMNHSFMVLRVDGISETDAMALNEYVEADGSSTSGTVRWGTADASGITQLTYRRRVFGC